MVEPPQKHLFAMPVARPLATFAPRKLLARGLAAASQFALRAHPTRPLRGGRIALVGEPDGFAADTFRQTASNCSTSGSTSAGSSVRTPFSKLRFFTHFAPIPAPVKLAEPKYALRPSTMMHLKCTRGQSIRSIPRHRSGYRSKSSRQFGSASCDRYAAQSLRSFGQPNAFGAGESGSFA